MKGVAGMSFGAHLRGLREAAGFTQDELATIAGLSVHAISSLERGERRRPQPDTLRALAAALDLSASAREALLDTARAPSAAESLASLPGATLPHSLTALVGRDSEVTALRRLVEDPASRLVTVVGTGGVGKTRLVLEIAAAVAAEASTAVVFVALSAAPHSAFVAATIAEAFGLSDVAETELPAHIRSACGDRPTLLVLDNFEHVLDAAPLVAHLLAAIPTLRILVTSRASLHVRGEREFALGPLALDATGASTLGPAVRLFVDRVRDVQPEFELTAANAPTVIDICRRLDALPLALELASPWTKVLPLETLRRRLEQDVLLSTIGPRDLPARQQTMNATVAWSYELLSPRDQRAFRRFGALPGLFPIEAAVAVLTDAHGSVEDAEALSAIANLIDKSLLVRAQASVVPTCQLYRMLETVRAYAALELAASGERDAAMEGVVRYCTVEASLAAEGLVGRDQAEWLDRVREDLESYRVALTWLIACDRSAEAAAIACDLTFFWVIRGHATEGLHWCEQILRLRSVTPAVESRALLAAGTLHYTQGGLMPARAALVRAAPLAADVGDAHTLAAVENILGHVELGMGKPSEARTLFARAVDRFRALDVSWGTGNALAGCAWVALSAGEAEEAERLLAAAAAALGTAGPWFLLLTLYLRAVLAVRRGEPDAALAFVHDSLTRIRELHDRFAFAYALVPLAAAAALKGEDEWAARILGAREAICESTGTMVVDESVTDIRASAERDVRARLGLDRWTSAWMLGRGTSIDSLIADIDRVMASRSTES
jgi:predicted ATPase/DNA-binding XRE family transcriptional regulator